jgi:predicted  nucleic acid-binding Zn-ribbon protein
MPGPAEIFRQIHRLRRFARDLQEQLDRIPRQLRAQQAKVARQEELYREAQDALKHLKVAVHDKEVTLKTTHGQVSKYQKQLNEAGSKKEYDALQAEIAAAREKCRQMEDEILNGMSESEEKAAQLPELDKAVKQAKEEYGRFEKEAGGRQADLAGQLEQVQAQLKEVEAGLPREVRPQYDRVIAARGADALAAVRNRTCTACNSEITAQNYNELQQDRFVLCKACGRVLYLPEQPA